MEITSWISIVPLRSPEAAAQANMELVTFYWRCGAPPRGGEPNQWLSWDCSIEMGIHAVSEEPIFDGRAHGGV
jgi:hypothetical protein